MSLLMQALRRAESAKKQSAAAAPAPATPPASAVPPAAPSGELTLELKEPTADEIAHAKDQAEARAQAEAEAEAEAEVDVGAAAVAQDLPDTPAAATASVAAAAERTEPVDYFAGEVPPPRAPYVPPAPQGFDPERGAAGAPPVPTPAPVAGPAPEVQTAARLALGVEQQQAAELAASREAQARAAASAVFASKRPVRSRRPLIIAVLCTLVLGGAAIAGYFMFLRPLPSSVLVQAPPPAPAVVVIEPALAPAAPVPVAAAEAGAPAQTTAPLAVPQPAAASPAAVPHDEAKPRAAIPGRVRVIRLPADPAPAAVAPALAPAAAGAAGIDVRRSGAASQLNPHLAGAYQSFNAGDTAAARSQYQRVLQQEPDNRDALLGMAAIAVNRGNSGEAGSFYARLLELDPSDPQAASGMASIQHGDPNQSESRLKGVLAASPDNAAALFALGNVYAEQARWPEAQQAFFRAVGSEPTNAGYAFNLAVSLDKLNQGKLALEYYRRALQLAQTGASTVNQATVRARIAQLERAR